MSTISVSRYYFYDDEPPSFLVADVDGSGLAPPTQILLRSKEDLFRLVLSCFGVMTEEEMKEFLARQLSHAMAAQNSLSPIEIERDGCKIEITPITKREEKQLEKNLY